MPRAEYDGAPSYWIHHCVRGMVVPAAALVAACAGFGVLSSDYFALQEVVVRSRTASVAREVAGKLQATPGTTFWYPLRSLVGVAEMCPRVRAAVPSRELPGRIVLTLEERQPTFCLRFSDGFHMVDPEGVLISAVPAPPAGFPVVVGPVEKQHVIAGRLRADCVKTVMDTLTGADKAGLGRHLVLDLTTRYDYTMLTPSGTLVKLGGGDNLVRKVMVATAAEARIREKKQQAAYIDVRVPDGDVYWKPMGA
jgi:cell division septal protein FtsQ